MGDMVWFFFGESIIGVRIIYFASNFWCSYIIDLINGVFIIALVFQNEQ